MGRWMGEKPHGLDTGCSADGVSFDVELRERETCLSNIKTERLY
jgi:hypothetical protein